MKKKIWIIMLILLILIVPIPGEQYRDGGTRVYRAIAYKIVVWNRLLDGGSEYHKTSVFWFPKNLKSIDELWELTYGQPAESTDGQEIGRTHYDSDYWGYSFTMPDHDVLVTAKFYTEGEVWGTNRRKTLEELMKLKGVGVSAMKTILSAYDIPRENINVIPWQNPISSYIGEYMIFREGEYPAISERYRLYVDEIRQMLGIYGSGT